MQMHKSNVWTPTASQNETIELLGRLLGQSFADRFLDFCTLASGTLPLRVSRPLAAHAIREFESSLREALTLRRRPEMTRPADETEKLAQAAALLRGLGFDDAAVASAGNALAPRDNHKAQIGAILKWLGYTGSDPVNAAWGRLRKVMKAVHERSFHDLLLVDDDFRREFQEPFETMVHFVAKGMQRRYSALLLRVEEITAISDREAAVSAFIKEVPGAPPLQWHFFSRLETEDWLPVLAKYGLLKPPFPHTIAAFPFGSWPAGSYLLKTVCSSDSHVRDLIVDALTVAANSARADVRPMIITILCQLSPGEAIKFSGNVVEWLQAGSDLPNHLVEQLVGRLADHGSTDEALSIAEALLRIDEVDGGAATRYSRGMYEHRLPALVMTLAPSCGLRALDFFVRLLVRYAVVEGKAVLKDRDATAYSLGPVADDQYAEQDLYSALIRAVRRSAEALLGEGTAALTEILAAIVRPQLDICRRIALHVLSICPSAAPDEATSELLDVELLENPGLAREYAELANAWFPLMQLEDQQTLLSLVKTVPDRYIDEWKVRRQPFGESVSAEDISTFRATMIREVTCKWESVLPASLREESAAAQLYAEAALSSEARRLRAADLNAGSDAEIVALLCVGTDSKSMKSLEQEWEIAVSQDPVRFAQSACDFADMPLVFVGAMIRGLVYAARNNVEIRWEPILVFLRTLIRANLSGNRADDLRDRLEVIRRSAELLTAGMLHERRGISEQLYPMLDQLLPELLEMASGVAGVAEQENAEARNAFSAARETPWGACIEMLVMRLRWGLLRRREKSDSRGNLDDTVIVRVLTYSLEMPDDRGRVTRILMGGWYGLLHYLNPEWAADQFAQVFTADDSVGCNLAWAAYVTHTNYPVTANYPSMRAMYEHELTSAMNAPRSEETNARTRQFAQHLLLLYLDGAIELTEAVLQRFLAFASVQQRASLMWTLDTILRSPSDEMAATRRDRALAYWQARLSAAKMETAARAVFQDELAVIGRWADNPQLDSTWMLTQLIATLKAGFTPSPLFNVVQRFADTGVDDIDRKIDLLDDLLNLSEMEHEVLFQRDAIRVLLDAALHSKSARATETAERLVSLLATKGEMAYLELLGR